MDPGHIPGLGAVVSSPVPSPAPSSGSVQCERAIRMIAKSPFNNAMGAICFQL